MDGFENDTLAMRFVHRSQKLMIDQLINDAFA